MASAQGQSPDLLNELEACSERSQAHMTQVRNKDFGRGKRGADSTQGRREAGGGRVKHDGGGDQDDPRLFYFRALLSSDRFFGGRRPSSGAVEHGSERKRHE